MYPRFVTLYNTCQVLTKGQAVMIQVPSLEFQRRFGDYQHQAQHEGPIGISRHGRPELVLMSVTDYELLVAAAKRTHKTAEAANAVIAAVEAAEMDREHAHLNELLR